MSRYVPFLLLALPSCLPQPSAFMGPTGAVIGTDGVVPVFVRDAAPASETVRHENGREKRWTQTRVENYRYRACTGIYAAPHVAVTSPVVLPAANENGVTVFDLNEAVFVGFPDHWRSKVVDVHDLDTIVLLRTETRGYARPQREQEVRVGERLFVASYAFHPPLQNGAYARPVPVLRHATVADDAFDELLGVQDTCSIRIEGDAAAACDCSAAVIDDDGKLAGVTLWRSGDKVSVLTVRGIRAAVRDDARVLP